MMIDKILPYEEKLFFLINGSHSDFWDNVMWLYSGLKVWLPLAILIIINIIYQKNCKQWLIILLALIFLFTLCDLVSSHIIKPLVARPRPTHFPGIMEHVRILYNYSGGIYGFISGHATNSFGFAMFTALLFRNRLYSIIIFAWAVIMVYSRVYLGVHFISDIVGGMIVGLLIGFIVHKVYKYIILLILNKSKIELNIIYPEKQVNIMSMVIILYIMLFFISSGYLIKFL